MHVRAVMAAALATAAISPAAADAAGYPDTVRADGARPYFRLGDPPGTRAADSSGAGRDGTFVGSVIAGRPGALADDAATGFESAFLVTADRIQAPDTFSLEVWFRAAGSHGGTLAGFADAPTGLGSSRDRLLYLDGSGHVVFGIYPNATVTIASRDRFDDGGWHHAVATLGAEGMELYVDGRKRAENPFQHAAASYQGYWRFGGEGLGGWPGRDRDYFAGDLDEAAVYPTQLSARQVADHYRAAGRTPAERAQAALTLGEAQQTIDGFGVNGDWWTIDLNTFPSAVQRNVADMLFGDRGLALSRYRYNIGGGGVGVTEFPGGATDLGPLQRAPRSFFQGPGIYDWTVDPGGIRFLKWADDAGVETIHAHVNSAPWYFTDNGQSCGGNLRTDRVGEYADYIATVVREVQRRFGVRMRYVSPMNEPSYTRSDCTQEGMAIAPAARGGVLQAVDRALRARAPWARAVGDESTGMGVFTREAPEWLNDPASAGAVAALATHTYDNPSAATRQAAGALARSYAKPLWMTEICCNVAGGNLYGRLYDPSMVDAMWMAGDIADDLTLAGASAYDWWQAVSGALGCDPKRDAGCDPSRPQLGTQAYNDGLLGINPHYGVDGDYRVWTTKRYYVLGQYSRFVRPGAVRYDVRGVPDHLRALAFRKGRDRQLVVINDDPPGTSSTPLRLSLEPGLRVTGAWQTSASRSLERVGAELQTSVPAQSVTTFTLRRE